jgi:hypothetical protein
LVKILISRLVATQINATGLVASEAVRPPLVSCACASLSLLDKLGLELTGPGFAIMQSHPSKVLDCKT